MEPVVNFVEMFAQSLNLQEPWYLERAEFNEKERAVHLYVGVRGHKFQCPKCGKASPFYDLEEDERLWRHNDVVLFPCYVHCRRPRVRCGGDGIHVVEAPWAKGPYSRYTMAFEGWAMFLLQSMSMLECSRYLRISRKALVHLATYWVDKAVAEDDLSQVKILSIDETAFKRGQRYVTVIGAPEEKRVIGVEDGRDLSAVERFSYDFMVRGGDCQQIKHASMDMSSTYLSGVKACFPEARIVYDHFHVKKLALEHMDEVRRMEQGRRFSRSRQAGKKLLMIPYGKMTLQQQERLSSLTHRYQKTGRAYRMVQLMDDFYRCADEAQAQIVFKRMTSWMMHSRLEPMKRLARSLREKQAEIFAYFTRRLSNAFAEGMNSVIQTAKRKARGFHLFESFRLAIYLVGGKLQLACPKPFGVYYQS